MTPSRFQIPMRIKVLEEYCLIRAKSGFIFHILHFTFSMFAEILSDPSGEWARTALMWGPEPRPLRVMRLPTWNSATTFPGPLNSSANHNSSQAQKYCVLWSAPRLLVHLCIFCVTLILTMPMHQHNYSLGTPTTALRHNHTYPFYLNHHIQQSSSLGRELLAILFQTLQDYPLPSSKSGYFKETTAEEDICI